MKLKEINDYGMTIKNLRGARRRVEERYLVRCWRQLVSGKNSIEAFELYLNSNYVVKTALVRELPVDLIFKLFGESTRRTKADKFFILDLEANRPSEDRNGDVDELIAVSIVNEKGECVYSELVQQHYYDNVSPRITEMTGISTDDLKRGKPIEDVLMDICEVTKGNTIIAYGDFDKACLSSYTTLFNPKLNTMLKNTVDNIQDICTTISLAINYCTRKDNLTYMSVSRKYSGFPLAMIRYFIGKSNYSIQIISAVLGLKVPNGNHHDSLHDCLLELELYKLFYNDTEKTLNGIFQGALNYNKDNMDSDGIVLTNGSISRKRF